MTANYRPATSRALVRPAVYATVLAVWALFVGLSVAHDKQPGDTIQVVPRTVSAAFHAACVHEMAPSASGLGASLAHSGDAGGGDVTAPLVAVVPWPVDAPSATDLALAPAVDGPHAPGSRAVGGIGCRGPPHSGAPV